MFRENEYTVKCVECGNQYEQEGKRPGLCRSCILKKALEYKEKCEELEKRLKYDRKQFENRKIQYIKIINNSKQDALLGKALKLMYEDGYLMVNQGDCIFNTRSIIDRYQQQLEKEDPNV